ncbi:MAG: NAD(P)/FAD-dependent oxidoreductase, partial [Anaerolineae bacterium]
MELGAQVVVVGGGAAGLMAAGQAAAAGAQVLVLERTARLGTKLRITGKGRCNLTNMAELDRFLVHFAFLGSEGDTRFFLRNAFARFFAPDLVAFFEGLDVATVVERGERVFPASNDAHQVAEALVRFAHQQGAQIQMQSRVQDLLCQEGQIRGVLLGGGQRIAAEAVIVATGGAS